MSIREFSFSRFFDDAARDGAAVAIVTAEDRPRATGIAAEEGHTQCHVLTPLTLGSGASQRLSFAGEVPAPDMSQPFGDYNMHGLPNDQPLVLTSKPELHPVVGGEAGTAGQRLTHSLDSMVLLRLGGRLDLLLLSAAAQPLLEGAHTALCRTTRVLILGRDAEIGRQTYRLLFEAGLVRVHARGETGMVAFLKSGLVTNLDWLEFGETSQVSFNQIGKMGRYGNQCFQAGFTVLYGLCNQARPVFPANDVVAALPKIGRWCSGPSGLPYFEVGTDLMEKALWGVEAPPVDVDFGGFFQNVPPVWRRHRSLLRRLLSVPDAVARAARNAATEFRATHGPLLAIHIRRGDFVDSPYPLFRTVPTEWVADFIAQMRFERGDIAVYIATDDPGWVEAHLGHLGILTGAAVRKDPAIDDALLDFSMLQNADIMGCANSSFSNMAALLADDTQEVYRPTFYRQRYERYDPWSADPFWAPFVFLSEADMQKYQQEHRLWLRCLGLDF